MSDKYRPVPVAYRNAPDCPVRPKSPLPHVLNDVAAFAFWEYRYLPVRVSAFRGFSGKSGRRSAPKFKARSEVPDRVPISRDFRVVGAPKRRKCQRADSGIMPEFMPEFWAIMPEFARLCRKYAHYARMYAQRPRFRNIMVGMMLRGSGPGLSRI